MDYRELVRNIFLAAIVGLASGYARASFAPDADLTQRVRALEGLCGIIKGTP